MKTPRSEGLKQAKRRAKSPTLLPLPKIDTPSLREYSKLSPLTLTGNKGLKGLQALSTPKKPRI